MSDRDQLPLANPADWKVDRTGWAPGPWDNEPDRVEWRYKGVPCLIVRASEIGQLCGYVGVPAGHPWHGVDADNIDASAHGGVNYSDACDPGGAICHVPQPGESDDVWWLGFDCAHHMDRMPGVEKHSRELAREMARFGTYRDVPYVKKVVEDLADQAIAAAAKK